VGDEVIGYTLNTSRAERPSPRPQVCTRIFCQHQVFSVHISEAHVCTHMRRV
jgi:hypothetical protein